MTLDEMIKNEQEKAIAGKVNAQSNQNTSHEAVNISNSTYVQPQSASTQQTTTQKYTKSTNDIRTNAAPSTSGEDYVYTIASSDDKTVNRDEFVLKSSSTYKPIIVPEDFYTVKLIGVDKKEAKAFDSDEIQPNFVWRFELISNSNNQQLSEKTIISKWCNAYAKSDQSNNYKFYEALMQKTPEDGYNILDCIGKYARAFICTKSWVDSKTNIKRQKSVIDKLLVLNK